MATLFFSYSHKDEQLRNELETHLAMLKRQGVISTWHDRKILAGDELDSAISLALESADIVLFLVSPDFLASNYCYEVEFKRAMERHSEGLTRAIPVILRPCDWKSSPMAKLKATPKDALPVVKWTFADDAFLDVVEEIRVAAMAGRKARAPEATPASRPVVQPEPPETGAAQPGGPRSSNLRLRRHFTEADKDQHIDDAFDFIARFFENSLDELKSRNSDVSARFRRIDLRTFTATVYRDGRRVGGCTVHNGGPRGFGGGLTYSHDDDGQPGSFNESLSVGATDQTLYLQPLGMPMASGVHRDSKLAFEGAAEYFWSLLIEPLQR